MDNWPIMAMLESPSHLEPRRYEFVAARTGLANHPPEGMIFHLTAMAPSGFIGASVWRDRRFADRWLAGPLGEALAAHTHQFGSDPDSSYMMTPVFSFFATDNAEARFGAQIGEAAGLVAFSFSGTVMNAVAYREAVELMKFAEHPPRGLIAHVATASDQSWRMFDIWEDDAAAVNHYDEVRRVFANADGFGDREAIRRQRVTRLDLHTLIVSPSQLDLMKRFDAPDDSWRRLLDGRPDEAPTYDDNADDDITSLQHLLRR